MTLPLAGTANQVAYSTSVAAQLAQVWLWDPAYALSQDPEVYEKMLRDIVVSGALDHLQRSIVGHDFSFEPEEDTKQGRDLATVVEALTKKQRFFPQSLYNLSRATFKGAAWARIYPKKMKLKIFDGVEREWTVVDKVRDVDKRRFRLTQSHASELDGQHGSALTSLEKAALVEKTPGLNSPTGYDAGPLGNFRWEFDKGWDGRNSSSMWWQSLERAAPYDHWVLHVPDTSEQGMSYGYGLADELYYFFWLKASFLRWAAQSAERYGQGFLVAKTKALREYMAKGYSQAAAMAATVQVMRTVRSENFIAVDELTDFTMIDMPGEGMRWIFEWVKYLDNGMTKRILAALQPTGGSDSTGGFSSAKVEEGSTESMISYLRSPLEETWTNTVVRFLVEHNEANLRELGLWGIGLSRLRLKGKESRDIEQMIKVFQLARELEIPMSRSYFYSVFNVPAPNEDADVIKYPVAAQPGFESGLGIDRGGDLDDEREPIGEGGSSVAESPSPGGNRISERNGRAV